MPRGYLLEYLKKEFSTPTSWFVRYESVRSKLLFEVGRRQLPLVSIVIPTYKRAGLLAYTLESALAQEDFHNYEIVVVDNDPEPDNQTPAVVAYLVERYPYRTLRYYQNASNIGMEANWNRGIELSRGQWISILHDDDLLHPRFLSIFSHVLRKLGKVDLLRFKVHFIDGEEGFSFGKTKVYFALLQKMKIRDVFGGIPAPGIIFRREVAEILGGFNLELHPVADYWFWLNAVAKFEAYYAIFSAAAYRVLDNMTWKGNTFVTMVEKSLEVNNFICESLARSVPEKRFFNHRLAMYLSHLRRLALERGYREVLEILEFWKNEEELLRAPKGIDNSLFRALRKTYSRLTRVLSGDLKIVPIR